MIEDGFSCIEDNFWLWDRAQLSCLFGCAAAVRVEYSEHFVRR
jgi:hypothetical protein